MPPVLACPAQGFGDRLQPRTIPCRAVEAITQPVKSMSQAQRVQAALAALGERYDGATPDQLALAWLLAKEIVPSVIIGARTFIQLEQNLDAANLELSAEDITRLDEISNLPELYPYRMIEAYGGRTFK